MAEPLKAVETTTPKLRIEIFSRRHLFGKRWYFRVKAGNNEIIATSEGYHNRNDARSTVMLLRNHFSGAELLGAW